MDQSVLSYCVTYRMDQSVLNSIFLKICSGIHNHSSDRHNDSSDGHNDSSDGC
jgi:hypothetical protein